MWKDRIPFDTIPAHTRAPAAATFGPMDEARAVLRRLERIEALEREGAPARSLLAEVHALVEEADAWIDAERGEAEEAAHALDRCRAALMEPAAVP